MPGKPELQKAAVELKANVFLPYMPRVCHLPGALTQLGFVWKNSSGFIRCVLPQEKGKQSMHFPAKSSRWAQPQARMVDDVQAHKKCVWKGRYPCTNQLLLPQTWGESVRASSSFQKSGFWVYSAPILLPPCRPKRTKPPFPQEGQG